jgi:hypothetical protein
MGAWGKNLAGDGGGALLKGARRGGNRGGAVRQRERHTMQCGRGVWAPIERRHGRDGGGQRSDARRRAEERREDRGGDRRRGHVEEERGGSGRPADDT